jgi:hypothetical protein
MIKRFHDILPYVANGVISIDLIKDGMSPCEIKRAYLAERGLSEEIKDAKVLDSKFEISVAGETADGWKRDVKANDAELDKVIADVNEIGVKK